LKTPIKHH
jgi:hypothetical protein